jgi:hypothetical protein
MPFKSAKQRRYLWANEPEIARRWTKEHGSRIQKDDGGIMRIPFAEGENYWRYKIDSYIEDELGDKWEDKFDNLSEEDRNNLETQFRADNISPKEIKDFINIKEHREKLDYAHDMWDKEKWFGQKTQPDIAKEYYDSEVKKHKDYIEQYKLAHPKSKIIQEAKAPLEGAQFASVLGDEDINLDEFMNERLQERIEEQERRIREQIGEPGGLPSLQNQSELLYNLSEDEYNKRFGIQKEPYFKEADPGQPVWDMGKNKYYDSITGREVRNPNIPKAPNEWYEDLKRRGDEMTLPEPFSPIGQFASFTNKNIPLPHEQKILDAIKNSVASKKQNVPLKFRDAKTLADWWKQGNIGPRWMKGLRNVDGDIRNIGQRWMRGLRNMGQGIGSFMGDRFQKRPAVGFTPAYYGTGAPRLNKQGQQLGYSAARLNQMNALGGYYSEPARAARRVDQRRINILNRTAAEKPLPVGNVNQLLGQYGYSSDGGGGIQFTGTPEGDSTAGAGYSRDDDSWSASPFARGGLASIWPR